MSALGQKQTLQCILVMSALPPIADIGTQPCNVRFVPKADILQCSSRSRPIGACTVEFWPGGPEDYPRAAANSTIFDHLVDAAHARATPLPSGIILRNVSCN